MQKPASLSLMSSIAMREALRELVPLFEQAGDHQVMMTFVGGVEIMQRLRAGEGGVDVVILQASAVDELVAAGKLAPGSRMDFARSAIGVAVRAGAPRPDLGSVEAVTRALLAAKSIAISSGPSGVYLTGVFERIGIPRGKVAQTSPGMLAGEVVARGEAEICFQQVSELLPVKGIDFLGPLLPEMQHVTVFSGGLHAASAEPQAARELMKFLASPAAAPVLRKKGMEPAH
jgi:molybdate transport system substrate-binding protein